MELFTVAEVAQVERHDKNDIEPEAGDNEWTQGEPPELSLVKREFWVCKHEIIWRIGEPGYPI